jgi:hypothetical protein
MARKQKDPFLPRMLDWMANAFRSLCRFVVLTAIMAGTMLILIDTGRFFFQSADFTITEISVEGNDRILKEEVQSLTEIVPGTNIWLIDIHEMQQRISNHPTVAYSYVQRIPPHRLHIRIVERKPMAYMWNEKDEQFYGIDENGVVFTAVPGGNRIRTNAIEPEWQELMSYPVISTHKDVELVLGQTVAYPRLQELLPFLLELKNQANPFFLALSECEILKDESIILHPNRRIGAMIVRNLHSPDLAKKIDAFWNVVESHDLRVIYVDARFPRHGFAVRWDESGGSHWKDLYQKEASVISSL